MYRSFLAIGEIEEMENLLIEVQQKLADGTKGPLPEGKYWIFMQREEYDDFVSRDEKLSKKSNLP